MIRFCLLSVVFILSTLSATTVLYQSFDDLVENADGIISGTVSEINYRKKKDDIYTYVTLRDITVHNGIYDDNEFTFRMLGGTIDDDNLIVEGTPRFSLDEKVILFISKNGKHMIPIVGWEQGVFKIEENDSNENYIVDANNNLVYDIDSNGVVHKQYNYKSKLHILDANSGNYIKDNTIMMQKNQKAMSKLAFLKRIKEKSKNKNKLIQNIDIENDLIKSLSKIDMPFSGHSTKSEHIIDYVDELPKHFKEESNETQYK